MKILLAVDGSLHARWAEAWVARFAGKPAPLVRVLTVTPPVVSGGDGPSLSEELRRNGERLVRTVARGLPNTRARGRVAENRGSVAGVILDEAERFKADLIVLGARGITPIKTFFLGSVSHAVSRHARASVLVARREPGRPLRALVAVDGSPAARRAIEFLGKLGIPRSTRVTLVHVVSEPFSLWVPETGLPGAYADVEGYRESLRELRRRGERVLEEARTALRAHFTTVQSRLREGYPASEILKNARAEGADLIVLGHRARSGLDRVFLGSVSQKVSGYAPASVLTVS